MLEKYRYLFYSLFREGKPWASAIVRRKFREVIKRAGLDYAYGIAADGRKLYAFSVHSLRHSFAKHMLEHNNNNIRLVKDLLRHSRLSSTEIYTQTSESELREAMNKLHSSL